MIRKIPFDRHKFIETPEQDVVTRDDRKVKILELDRPSPYFEIVAMDEYGTILELNLDGRSYPNQESDDDIFLLVDEPEPYKPLTDLELKVSQAITSALSGTSEDGSMSWATVLGNEDAREITKQLIEIFKEELLPSRDQLRKVLEEHNAIRLGGEDPFVATWLRELFDCIGI